jgi:hypothetical protein
MEMDGKREGGNAIQPPEYCLRGPDGHSLFVAALK